MPMRHFLHTMKPGKRIQSSLRIRQIWHLKLFLILNGNVLPGAGLIYKDAYIVILGDAAAEFPLDGGARRAR
jgi:hypothetical protein